MSARQAWCTSTLIVTPVRYTLCVTEKAYAAEMRRLRVAAPLAWISAGAGATCHTLECDGETRCVVCIPAHAPGMTGIQTAALLVHEAVHVWQAICRSIGENHPSAEFEAYSVQCIAQELMARFAELRGTP